MFKTKVILFSLATLLFTASLAFSHSPFCSCKDNGDGTVSCEGGFSDGSSAKGVAMYVKDKNGNEIVKGKINDQSEFSFKKPATNDYTVLFDAGEGHRIEIKGKDIF